MTQQDILIANSHRIMLILESFTIADEGLVNIKLYEKNGEEVSYSFKNINQILKELELFNLKIVDGVLLSMGGDTLSVSNSEKLANKTLAEVRANINATKIGNKSLAELDGFLKNEPVTPWLEATTIAPFPGTIKYRKYKNGFVEVNIASPSYASHHITYRSIGSLPVGFRPSIQTQVFLGSQVSYTYQALINTEGAVSIRSLRSLLISGSIIYFAGDSNDSI